MAYQPDVDAMEPTLELSLDFPKRELRCAGRLDRRTGHHVMAAVGELLVDMPTRITVDVARVTVGDVDGANVLPRLQKMVVEAGGRLRWQGLDSDHFGGILPPRHRAGSPRRRSAESAALRARHPSMGLRAI